NLENTLYRLLQLRAIPIINENDSVATEEIAVGDNDTMGAIVAKYMQADLLVLLSDIEGLYTADPRTNPNATLIGRVEEITPEIEALAGGAGSSLGTGGMATKLMAARIATTSGVDMVIANGAHASVLYDIVEGKSAGTRFTGRRSPLLSKQ
ncbi:MAG: glutamate 5-kinase, partial [Gemmiger sp.]